MPLCLIGRGEGSLGREQDLDQHCNLSVNIYS